RERRGQRGRLRRRRRGAVGPARALAPLAPGARLPPLADDRLGPGGDLPAAVVAALGAAYVVVDVAHAAEVARAAVGAALDRAVGREAALDGPREFLAEEALAHAGGGGRRRDRARARRAPRARGRSGSGPTSRRSGRRGAVRSRARRRAGGRRGRRSPRAA